MYVMIICDVASRIKTQSASVLFIDYVKFIP